MSVRAKLSSCLSYVVLGITVVACAQQPVAEPSPGLEGVWQGRVVDNVGSADAELTLVRSSDKLSGEVVLSFSVGLVRRSVRGEVVGRVEGSAIRLDLIPGDDAYCPYRATMTHTDHRLTGSYRGVGCVEEIEGELHLEKQP